MELVPKCLLLPIDGTEESLRSVSFLGRLYPRKDHIGLILSYFLPPLSPIYRQKPDSEQMARKKKEAVQSREEDTRSVLNRARKVLIEAGFSEETIQEHVEEKQLSTAHHACRLADVKQVDAVVVQKLISSGLEGFLKGDPTPALLHHCLVSPVWLITGTVDPSHAAICLQSENASLRAADHAGFMLAETTTRITILHASQAVSYPITSPGFEPNDPLERWLATPEGSELKPFLTEACRSLADASIAEDRAQITVIPSKGDVCMEILRHGQEQGFGIVVLGHSSPGGTWGFLKSSITRKILASFKDMAVWVSQ